MAKYDFHTNFNGRACSVGNSAKFNSMSFKERNDLAFSKKNDKIRNGLTCCDNSFLAGYAQKTREMQKAFKYNHPNYNCKNYSGNNTKKASRSSFRKRK